MLQFYTRSDAETGD